MPSTGIPGCLNEDTVLAFDAGRLSPEALSDVERHLAICRDCSWLVTVAVLVREEALPGLEPGSAPGARVAPLASNPCEERFEELELIAEGAMGAVYRGIDLETGSLVAIKRLKRAVLVDHPDVALRFARESEILRRLDHPNIVKIIASIDHGDDHRIVMEYMPGGSLRGLLRAQGRLSPERSVALLLELTDALARAHHLEILHRDLKPENVLLAADGTPRLSDFGLSRWADREGPGKSPLVGTLPYSSPEALAGGPLDARADLWALGVLLFEMLTGKRPFRGETPAALFRAILQDPLPNLAAAGCGAPLELVELSQRLLARDPEERVPSARQLGALLEALQKSGVAAASGSERVSSGVGSRRLSTESSQRALELPSLPRAMTPFIGRSREVASILRLLQDPAVQLVTLTGPGGMGKSRVALEVARRVAAADPPSKSGTRPHPLVCFVDLTSISDPQLIVSVLGAALGYAFPSGGADTGAQLCAYLREKELLLLIDNFEHVLPAAGFIARLLEQAPRVQVLATSREPLRLSGEAQFALGGMEPNATEAGERGLEPGAVELFVASARRVRADFDPARQMPAIIEVCRAVHGMPLGILLASSWVALLGPREIADEIRRSPDFLQDERLDLPVRQRSLRAVFDHSWALLEPKDQEIFARLSAFRAGFTRAAAEFVAGARLENLAKLLGKSLLEWQPSGSRYVIHELLRQYAEEKLGELPSRELTLRRLGEFFSGFLEQREAGLQGLCQRQVVQEISTEMGNIRSAWQGLLGRRELDRISASLWPLCVYHRRRGARAEVELVCAEVASACLPEGLEPSPEAQRLGGVALAIQALHAKDQGKRALAIELMSRSIELMADVGECRERALATIISGWVMNDVWTAERCIESAEQGLAFYRGFGHGWCLAEAMAFTAQVHLETAGEPGAAEALLRENLELQRQLNGGSISMPTSLCLLGLVLGRQGAWREGCEVILQGLEVGEQLHDVWAIEGALRLAARAKLNLGELDAAASYARRCMKLCRETGALESVAWCKFTLAEIAKQCGRLDDAAELYSDARELSPPDTAQLANAVMNLGDIAMLRGQYRQAERYFQDGLAAFQARRVDWGVINTLENLGLLACTERRYPEAKQYFERALELGLGARRFPLVVNVIASFARYHRDRGQLERASELLGWAQQHPALHHQTRTRCIEPLLGELGQEWSSAELEAALARGGALELQAAVQKALELPGN